MDVILKDNGDLVVALGYCVAAERVHPDDPRYPELLPTAVREADLRGTPEANASLLAEMERRFQERQAHSI